jgi:hypothetical protein
MAAKSALANVTVVNGLIMKRSAGSRVRGAPEARKVPPVSRVRILSRVGDRCDRGKFVANCTQPAMTDQY